MGTLRVILACCSNPEMYDSRRLHSRHLEAHSGAGFLPGLGGGHGCSLIWHRCRP